MKSRVPTPLLLLLLLVLLLGSPAAAPASNQPPAATAVTSASGTAQDSGIIARVNDEPVFLEDIERRLQDLHSQASETHRSAFDLDQLIFRLVNDTLLAQEARALGMADEAPVQDKLAELRRELAVTRLKTEAVADRVHITDDDVRAAFEREYRRATLRVLTTHETSEAEQALAELRAGADFAELAKERSKDPYALRGGLVEALPRIDLMSEIADVAFDLEPGALFGPIRTPIGYAVIRLESVEPADPERFEETRKDLRQMLGIQQSKQRQDELAAELRAGHDVTIDHKVLAGIVPERIDDGRLMPAVDDPDAVLVRIDDRRILASEYGDALKWRWKGVRNEEAAKASAPLVLDQLIEEKLLLVEAIDRGYDRTTEVDRKVAALEKELLVTRYLQEVLGPMVTVEDDEIKEYYEANRDLFPQPPRLHLAQITVETREQADELAKLLHEGADVSWLARKHSIDRFKTAGGDRGWMVPAPNVDEFNDSLMKAKEGDVLGPFGVPGNYIVIKVDALEPQPPYPFERVEGNIRSALFRQKFAQLLDEVVHKLRSRSEIDVYDDVLASLSITGTEKDDAEPAAGHGH